MPDTENPWLPQVSQQPQAPPPDPVSGEIQPPNPWLQQPPQAPSFQEIEERPQQQQFISHSTETAQASGFLGMLEEQFSNGAWELVNGGYITALDIAAQAMRWTEMLGPTKFGGYGIVRAFSGAERDDERARYRAQTIEAIERSREAAIAELPRTFTGTVTREIGRAAAYYTIASRMLGVVNMGGFTRSVVSGAMAELATYGGDEDRLSDLAKTWMPEGLLREAFVYMSGDDDDPYYEAKMKQAMEGAVMGPAFELGSGVVEAMARPLGRMFGALRRGRRSLQSEAARNPGLWEALNRNPMPLSAHSLAGMRPGGTIDEYMRAITPLDQHATMAAIQLLREAPQRIAGINATSPPTRGLVRLYDTGAGWSTQIEPGRAYADSQHQYISYRDVPEEEIPNLPRITGGRVGGTRYVLPTPVRGYPLYEASNLDGKTWGQVRVEMLTSEFERRLRDIRVTMPDGSVRQLEPEDIARKLDWFQENVAVNYRPGPAGSGDQVLSDIDASIARGIGTQTVIDRGTAMRMYDSFSRMFVDRSGTAKRLLRQAGDAGQYVQRQFELAAGSNVRGADEWERVSGQIWRGGEGRFSLNIPRQDYLDLNTMIATEMRIWQAGPDDLEAAMAARDALAQRMSPTRFARLRPRVDRYFDTIRAQAQKYLDAGIIDADRYEDMVNFRFANGIELIQAFDPIITFSTGRGRPLQASMSGLTSLQESMVNHNLMANPEMLLSQIVMRANNALSRNKANVAMYQLAVNNPDMRWLRATEPSTEDAGAYIGITAYDGGQGHKFWLAKELGDEWAVDSAAFDSRMRMAATWMSGSALVRPMATGVNPAFGVKNFFRDLMTAWLQPNLFSRFAPIAAFQMGRDLAAVAGDVWGRKGRVRRYFEQGGGMHFLTHQGNPLIDMNPVQGRSRLAHSARRITNGVLGVMGYLNESMELWVRMAIRERAIKNHMAERGAFRHIPAPNAAQFDMLPDAAKNEVLAQTREQFTRVLPTPEDEEFGTWVARTYIDFSQGGYLSKGIDSVIPYFNPSIQGLRSVSRGISENPVEWGIKVSQIMGAMGALAMANRINFPQHSADVPNNIRTRNWIINTPFGYVDHNGAFRSMYFKMPMDQSFAFIKGIVEGGLDYYGSNRPPDEAQVALLDSFKSGVANTFGMVDPTNLPPSVQAISALALNMNTYTLEQIWRGDDVNPEEQYVVEGAAPTSELAKDVGGALGLSPMALETATQAILPSNLYTQLASGAYNSLMKDMTPSEVDGVTRSLLQQMARMPGFRDIVGFTYPFEGERTGVDLDEREIRSQRLALTRDMEARLDPILLMEEGAARRRGLRDFERWLNETAENNPAHGDALNERYGNMVRLEEVRRELGYDRNFNGTISFPQLLDMAYSPPAARAQNFAEEWMSALAVDDRDTIRLLERVLRSDMPGFSVSRGQSQWKSNLRAERQALLDQGVDPGRLWRDFPR